MTQSILAKDVTRVLDAFAPPSLSMQGDVIGLQIGRLDKPVSKVWCALDASPTVIKAATQAGVDLLITHHAMLYRPAKQIDTTTPKGRAIAMALKHDLTVYNAHTNLDIAEGGVNDVIADMLRLAEVEILDRMQNERLRKLVVFIPKTHHDAVLQAVCEAGAGHIGAYSHCTFNSPGEGTFLPSDQANPYIGQAGTFERVPEIRLETVVPERLIEPVVRAMLHAHPYEEVAYDIYPLERMGKATGLGRVGNLASPMTLSEFAALAQHTLGLKHIRFSGDPNTSVQRIAVLGGSGGRWASHAIRAGAQVLLTADCDHHTVSDAWNDGLAIVDATHAALEVPVLRVVQEKLQEAFGTRVCVEIANVAEDPFHWL
jgi:dinuclear metal center YbgI/SA1388 family protein